VGTKVGIKRLTWNGKSQNVYYFIEKICVYLDDSDVYLIWILIGFTPKFYSEILMVHISSREYLYGFTHFYFY